MKDLIQLKADWIMLLYLQIKKFLGNYIHYLHIAAINKNSKILSLLLQKSQIDINSVNEKGETPLIEACKSKCNDNINLLFKNDSLDFLHCNKDGKDALDIILNFIVNQFHPSME